MQYAAEIPKLAGQTDESANQLLVGCVFVLIQLKSRWALKINPRHGHKPAALLNANRNRLFVH